MTQGSWPKWFLPALFIILVSLVIWRQDGMFSRDGAVFLGLADLVREGKTLEALEHPHHPLTFFLIGNLWKWGWDPVVAGRFLSVLSLALILCSVHALTSEFFDRNKANWSTLWLMFTPHLLGFGTDILSDPLYWASVLTGFTFLIKSLRQRVGSFMLFAGFLFSLAYLARPEGFVMSCFIIFYLLIQLVRKKMSFKFFGFFSLSLSLGMALYVVPLHQVSGEWRLSRKVNFIKLLQLDYILPAESGGQEVLRVPGLATEAPVDYYAREDTLGKIRLFLSEQSGNFLECLWYPQTLILLCASGYLFRERRRLKAIFLLGFFQLLITQFQWFDDHYLSRRHWMLVTLCLAVCVGPAWVSLKNNMLNRFSWLLVVIAGCVALEKEGKFFKSEEARRKHLKIPYKEMGEKLRERGEEHVIGRDLRVAWFAGNKTYIQWLERENPFLFINHVQQVVEGTVIILVPKRRAHEFFNYEKIIEGIQKAGYIQLYESELEVAFVHRKLPRRIDAP